MDKPCIYCGYSHEAWPGWAADCNKKRVVQLQSELDAMTKYLKGNCESCCYSHIRSGNSRECVKCKVGSLRGPKWVFNESKEGQGIKKRATTNIENGL